jgi:hypothetical protein
MSYTHDQKPQSPSEELFGEIISSYTDAEALEDGFLAELQTGVMFRGLPINRMTSHLFDDLRPFVEAEAPLFDGDFDRALASILRTKCSLASGDPGQHRRDRGYLPDSSEAVARPQRGWRLDCHVPGGLLGPQKQQESGKNSRSLSFCSDHSEPMRPSFPAAASTLPSERAVPQQSCCVQLDSLCALVWTPLVLFLPIALSARAKFSVAPLPRASVLPSSVSFGYRCESVQLSCQLLE